MAVAGEREDAARRPGRGAEADRRDVDHDQPLHEVAERVAAEVGVRGRDVERREALQQVADVEAEREHERPREHHVEDGGRDHAVEDGARDVALRLGRLLGEVRRRFEADEDQPGVDDAVRDAREDDSPGLNGRSEKPCCRP